MNRNYMNTSFIIFITSCVAIVITLVILLNFNKGTALAMGGVDKVVDEDVFARQRKRMVEEQIAYRYRLVV